MAWMEWTAAWSDLNLDFDNISGMGRQGFLCHIQVFHTLIAMKQQLGLET